MQLSMDGRSVAKRSVAKWAIDCGDRVQQKRIADGLSRDELAGRSGVDVSTIARIECGVLNPRDDLRWLIAKALATRIDELWPTADLDALTPVGATA